MSKLTTEQVKEKLIAAGVKNLKEFGYPHVTPENILTDEVYKEFFRSMLEDNKGQAGIIDRAKEELLKSL